MVTNSVAIFTHFQHVTDPRIDRKKLHSLYEMIVVALCGTICGAQGWADIERFGNSRIDWFRKLLTLENGIASHDTFGRVFGLLDTQELLDCLQHWVESLQLKLKGQGVHIDGKTLRRSFDSATGRSALHVVSAWASELRICLGQVAVDDKSNEITAVPKLLELLEITGAVVTLDAMHCQKKTAAKIREQNADYILQVKKNQPTLFRELEDLFAQYAEDNFESRACRVHRKRERNRSRNEERVCMVAPAPSSLKRRRMWKDIKTVGMVYRHREVDGAASDEVSYFISSLPPKVRLHSKHIRSHWSVENTLHWSLDVTFTEDSSRIRKGFAPEIASMFRRLALTILQRDTTLKESIRGKRLIAGWNSEALSRILTGNNA